tara:strand:+ start:247 stop:402 length:156 start_codon:yes stop_codon:yes gene_type:complete
MSMDIKYLDHPCSTADKKEWNAKGFKIVDSRFAPVGQEKPIIKRKRKVKKD